MIESDLASAVLDSCVLYPPGLRNLFLWLAVEEVYFPRWTEAIHEEWIRNALENDARKNHPPLLSREKLERTRDLMNRNADRSVVTGFEHWIPRISLPDPDDRHVLAAAIESESSYIVTFNLRHFPASALSAHGVEAIHPDSFLCKLFEDNPNGFLRAVEALRNSLKNPPLSGQQLLKNWRKAGLPRLVEQLQVHWLGI
jgi:hypothetical protein